MVLLLFSYGFLAIVLLFACVFPGVLLSFLSAFPVVFLWFSSGCSQHFPLKIDQKISIWGCPGLILGAF